jgi:hypothetical protein
MRRRKFNPFGKCNNKSSDNGSESIQLGGSASISSNNSVFLKPGNDYKDSIS